MQLTVNLKDLDSNSYYAEYSTFKVGNEAGNFRLTVGGYIGYAGVYKESNCNG